MVHLIADNFTARLLYPFLETINLRPYSKAGKSVPKGALIKT